jgi:hypothetical protein
MSMSISGSSGPLSNLQSLLQQAATGASGSTSAADPLSALLSSVPDSSTNLDPTNATPTASGVATLAGQQFSAATMDELIRMQGASANGGTSQSQLSSLIDTNASTATASADSSTDDGTSSDNSSVQGSGKLLDQLTQLQSQLLPLVAPAILAIA